MEYRDEAMQRMADWFLARYTDPADLVYYDSKEDGYQFSGNGPYDALDILKGEFEGKVAKDKIEKVAADLTAQCGEWVAKRKPPYLTAVDLF